MSAPRRLQTLENATEMIDHIRAADGLAVTELAERVEMSPGTVHTYLSTLKAQGYIEQRGSEYRLGPTLLTHGEYYRNKNLLFRAGKKEVEQLATDTGECIHLIIEHNGEVITLYDEFGTKAVGTKYHTHWREEPKSYLHCISAGKAILAGMSDKEVWEIIETKGLERQTPNTITDPEELFDELDRIRETGVAWNDEEEVVGIRAVGVAITDADGEVLGAISLTAPTSRMAEDYFREELPQKLKKAVNIIEVKIETNDFHY
ncbi:IclR family transcriptional regulator [Natrarchaeobius oligotrophus]|nr:IclR family transcriptional regulator [Natrarchaeobius chitinivorans]